MNGVYTINFAKDFTDMPIGRYRSDGPHSGEVFRDDILLPALLSYPSVTLNLNDVYGFGSSFLEEAFGGLIRSKKISLLDVHRKLHIISDDDPYIKDEIGMYLQDADRNL